MSKGFQQRAVEQVAEPGAFTGELIAGRVVGWKVPLNWEDRSCDRPIRPERRSTFQVMKRSRLYPRPAVASGAVSAVGQAGGVLLTETIRAAGLDVGLSTGLTRW